jgi:WD40 repeat protein
MSSTTITQLNNNSMLLDEVSDLWSGLNTSTSSTNLARFKNHSMEERRIQTEHEEIREETNRWDCVATFEGHVNPVLSIAYFSNCLISTSVRSLKMWDIESGKVISDVGGQHLSGYVRSVVVDP